MEDDVGIARTAAMDFLPIADSSVTASWRCNPGELMFAVIPLRHNLLTQSQ
ncbi:MAG: hypothetical protein ACRD3W_20105 [Terriglobales bacterium]